LNKADAAMAAVTEGLKLAADNPYGYVVRGDIRRQNGQSDGARADYAEALKLGAKGLALQMAQAGLALLPAIPPKPDPEGDAKKCADLAGEPAIAACSRAIDSGRLTGRLLAATYVNRCFEWLQRVDYEQAVTDCDRAIHVDETIVYAHVYKAEALLGKGDANGAREAADRAVRMDGNNGRAYAARGEAYRVLRQPDAASADFSKALDASDASSVTRRLAQGGLLALSSKLNVAYEAPTDARFRPYYIRLRQLRVLERLQQFLSPLRLPRSIDVTVKQCGAPTVPYTLGGPVTICYELIGQIARIVHENIEEGSSQGGYYIAGAFVQAVLHDVSNVIFDVLDVPIWGRREDAADQLAAFIMAQFGEDAGRIAMVGSVKLFEWSKMTWTGSDFAATQSPAAQRFYNYLCVACGGYPVTYSDMKKYLPVDRAKQCWSEYDKIRRAFNLRIMPFVDPELTVRVKSTTWIWSDDVK
jgi:tetratricopeptide (TPR) repeat protein